MQGTDHTRFTELLQLELSKIQQLSEQYLETEASVKVMEIGLMRLALQMCLTILGFLIQARIARNKEKKQSDIGKNVGSRSRQYQSLFGLIEYERPCYWKKEKRLYAPVDNDLGMPAELWSYNLQELIGANASEVNFRESIHIVNQLLGLDLCASGSERNICSLGEKVEDFYATQAIEVQMEPVCYSATFDGKGVPKVTEKKVAETEGETKPRELKRMGRGEKRGYKQMATVGVISYFTPKKRSIPSVLRGLLEFAQKKKQKDMSEEEEKYEPDNGWHQGIHRRAFLADQEKCVDYGIRYIKERMGNPQSKFVVPIDAGIGLEDKVLAAIEKYELTEQFDGIILDIIHVSEYAWACANAIFGDGSKERFEWVKSLLNDILHSKTQEVIQLLTQAAGQSNLSTSRKEVIEKAIKYYTNHQHKMDYKTFIEKGYPVSSALVESNCKHLVKDRMEQSGMRWSTGGAQQMMDVRAVKLNGDMPEFIKFVEQSHQTNLKNRAA
jgi:hypothetical protein